MKILKSKKALSPVVASIILIAVTVAVSIAVAAWMGALTFTFMATEEVKVISHEWENVADPTYIELKVTNVGTGKVTLKSAEVNNVGATSDILGTGYVLEAGSDKVVTVTYNFMAGIKYDFNIVTAKGTKSPYTATAPT